MQEVPNRTMNERERNQRTTAIKLRGMKTTVIRR